MTGADDIISETVIGHFTPDPPDQIGVAVSGGGDSVALLHILSAWAKDAGVRIRAITVDHNLRDESRIEAEQVAAFCSGIGVDHHIALWDHQGDVGNIQSAARDARYELILKWAKKLGIEYVALGHTADDQAETVLMRLARGAGVDGLSAMNTRRIWKGITLVRPMLHLHREKLRDYLRHNSIEWIDDPSNQDLNFDRIKARQALSVLAPLGIDILALNQVADNMFEARKALCWNSFLVAHKMVQVFEGWIRIDRRQLRTHPVEIQRRVLQQALCWVSGIPYGPRRKPMMMLLDAIDVGSGMTLHGCQIDLTKDFVYICREYNAVQQSSSDQNQLWDGRWQVSGPWDDEMTVRALGPLGLTVCENRSLTGVPGTALRASPAIWRRDELLAAPLAGWANGWSACDTIAADSFFSALTVH